MLREVVALTCLSSHLLAQDMRCKVGLTFTGLGDMDGDYMGNGNNFVAHSISYGELRLGFTWTDPDHPQRTPYGCDMYSCSAADQALARGKWGILGRTDISSMHYRLLAVCESGCPDLKPSCTDIFNEPPSEPNPLHCPIWPATWNSTMEWKTFSTTSNRSQQLVSAHGVCCRRKPMECDACDQHTCTGLIGLLHNNCPPNQGSFLNPVSEFQKHCCEEYRPPPLELPSCGCSRSRFETKCDHGEEDVAVTV